MDKNVQCGYCRFAYKIDKPFVVYTEMDKAVTTVFNYCPVCGRKLNDWPDELKGDIPQ